MSHPYTYAHTDTTRPYPHSIQQHTRVLSDSCSLGASANPGLTLTRTSRRRDLAYEEASQLRKRRWVPFIHPTSPLTQPVAGFKGDTSSSKVSFVSGLADGRHTGPKEKASWDVKALPRNQPGDPGEFLDLGPQLESRRLGSAPGCWDAQRVLSQECPRVLVSEA